MLSSSPIKNSSQASHYFSTEDNYYAREEGIEQSEWWGKGAEKLQLNGQVDSKQFTDLLNGKLATGEVLGKMVDGQIKHRPGWDLTFSAPKSVSIMALVGEDKRLIEAHRQAVNVALSHIENNCGEARIKINGTMTYEKTNNIVAALYHHDLSRAKDPQLHTHSVVMNMTERSDGKWRSLASSKGKYNEAITGEINGFIERVRHHNRYYSKIYETELAFRIKQLGYEINHQKDTGIFEIADVPKEAIDHFSKRRQEIESTLEEKGLSGGKAASIATLATREKKEKVDREQLGSHWRESIKQFSLDLQKIIDKTKNPEPVSSMQTLQVANEKALAIVRDTSQTLAVFQSTFSLEKMVEEASKEAITNHISIHSLLDAITQETAAGNLIPLASSNGKTVLMAKSTADDEKRLIENLTAPNSAKVLINKKYLEQFFAQHDEIAKDLHADIHSLFEQDLLVLVEGENNKNRLAEPIIKLGHSGNLSVAILSPSLIGSKQLAQQLKQKPEGLWEHIKSLFVDNTPKHYSAMQFLAKFDAQNTKDAKPDILLVDQAHLLSTYQKSKLVEWNKQQSTKLILFGNTENLLSYQVSTSLQQLKDHGIKTIPSRDSLTSAHSNQDKTIQHKLSGLAERMLEVQDDKDRHSGMVTHFSRLSQDERCTSWLATYTKANAEHLNKQVHEHLMAEGKLGKAIHCKTLLPHFIPKEKLTLASSYEAQQVIRFNERYSSLNIEQGNYLKITKISKQSNRIILQKENGKRIIWQPDKIAASSEKIEVFREVEREISVGENIVLSRSIKVQGLVKGERCHIESLSEKRAIIKNAQGKSVVLDLSKPSSRHFDYGYAATLHAITHEKPTILIADLPSNQLSTDQRRLSQLTSQSKQLWVYTDDTKKLADILQKQTGERLSIETITAKSAETKAALHAIYDVLDKELNKLGGTSSTNLHKAIDAVDYAIKHLGERQAGFTHEALVETALRHAVGDVTESMIQQVTAAMEKSKVLIHGHHTNGILWTTAEAVKLEREIIALSQKDQGKMTALADAAFIRQSLDDKNLRSEQIAAIQDVLLSHDRVLAIQGRAGTGKTTMMASLDAVLSAKNLMSDSGYSLCGIAPTHKAVKELRARGIEAQTIDRFLLNMKKIANTDTVIDFSKTLLVVDEASMVSNRKMLEVLTVVHAFQFCRVIPTGDTHQNPAIESGKPQDLIHRSLKNVIHLNDIQRQKNPVLKAASLALYEGEIKQSFALLDKKIIEIQDENEHKKSTVKFTTKNHEKNDAIKSSYEKRIKDLVKDYFDLTAQGEAVQIIAPSHADRKAINHELRYQLNQMGKLQGESHSLAVLSSKDMTAVERSKVTNFKQGDIVRFTVSSGKSIQAGDYFEVKGLDKTHHLLVLNKLNEPGQEVVWQVPRSTKKLSATVEIFKREARQLQVGDKIVWTRTNQNEGLISAEFSEILTIDNGQVTAKQSDDSLKVFNANDPKYQHWDHAYALTTYSTQGGTYSAVLALFESYRNNLMNLKTFLVTITRAVNELRIYTDNKAVLQDRMMGNRGDKISSLEVIGEYPKEVSRDNKTQQKALQSNKREPVFIENKIHFDRLTIEKMTQALNADAEKIAVDLLGNPKVRGSNFLKFGSHKGSLSVTTKGEHQGWWHDFAEGKGGKSMLSFIQHHAGLTRKEALLYGTKWAGIDTLNYDKQVAKLDKKTKQVRQQTETIIKQDDKNKIAFAKKLADQSQPIAGTLVEKYLKNTRGLELKNHPEDIRFHPNVYSKLNGKSYPAMLVIARDHSGKVKAVQATYLNSETENKVDSSKIAVQKQTFGVMKGAAVTLPGDRNAPILIAEGTETGLSLKQALSQATVKITLSKSNFKNLDVHSLSQKTVLCLDQDGKDFKDDRVITESAKRLMEANKEVRLMIPESHSNQKKDYNDLLKKQGVDAIKADFERAISAHELYGTAIQPKQNERGQLEKMAHLSRELHTDKRQNNQVLVNAYRNMSKDFQRETTKIPIKQNDFEQGL